MRKLLFGFTLAAIAMSAGTPGESNGSGPGDVPMAPQTGAPDAPALIADAPAADTPANGTTESESSADETVTADQSPETLDAE